MTSDAAASIPHPSAASTRGMIRVLLSPLRLSTARSTSSRATGLGRLSRVHVGPQRPTGFRATA